jgi:RND superfamily putative drug exporter
VLLIFPLYFLRSFAYAGISVVAVATIGAVVVLPAALVLLGRRVNAWAVRPSDRLARAESPFWRRVAVVVMRRPVACGLPVVLALLALAIPFLHVRWGSPDDRVIGTGAQARQVGDAMRQDFTVNSLNTLDVVTEGAVRGLSARGYSRTLSLIPGIVDVSGPAGTWARGARVAAPGHMADATAAQFTARRYSWFQATIGPDWLSGRAESLVRQVRALPAPSGVATLVGGAAATLTDQKHDVAEGLPLAGTLIVTTTLIVLFLFTGSVVLPIKALALNALSLTAVLGAIVWIFQDGHLSGVLNFTPGPTSTSIPLLLFCIAFGLSMDYELFILSRIRELHEAGADNFEAIATGLGRAGRIVSTAAALLAVTFFALAFSHVSFIQLFGVGTGLAILVDATLIRGVLVPAFMALAGRANWWAPGPLRRLHRRIGLSEGEAAVSRGTV